MAKRGIFDALMMLTSFFAGAFGSLHDER